MGVESHPTERSIPNLPYNVIYMALIMQGRAALVSGLIEWYEQIMRVAATEECAMHGRVHHSTVRSRDAGVQSVDLD